MRKDYLILIISGIVLGVIIIGSRKRVPDAPDVIKPGDKSNEVYGLQNALTGLTGVKFNNMGAYDNDTLSAVQCFMVDTSALVDYDKGYVSKRFASDLYKIQDKLKKG